ncbi:GNAT family N-acetyltransferase [Dyella flagellata]|uniref:N-acetyltransferase n=1 Tax=Dyella flagellata TaxID=1867833 RepID=A0ABQ5X4C3_9GAMM|nr:GNAT family N-acetyltransferase [Dyella flagellata]GLQ86465.1 N-acetyltransferase [Dyella flagellata]
MQIDASLPAFPPTSEPIPACASLGARGIGLRCATPEDLPFLRQLYGELRADELRMTGWPASACEAFLGSQFALQHRHFVSYYADADFLMVESGGTLIGRYYLLRQNTYFTVVDIALLPSWRGRGIGGALLQWAQSLAHAGQACGIDLHVDVRNTAAHRLYARLGFVDVEQESPYIRMRWEANPQLNTA